MPAPCPNCGFVHQCICASVPILTSPIHLALLMHENEVSRETNTGKLLQQTLTNCTQHIWQRKTPPSELIKLINSPDYHAMILFPSEESQLISTVSTSETVDKPIPLFIILDATWQEAKKMIRRSAWLQALPHVHFETEQTSRYSLRRNQHQGHLCTCEVGAELLKQTGSDQEADKLMAYFEHYLAVYQADRCGHVAPTTTLPPLQQSQ
ncbi:DTW domain-containing protein [Vibrio sp. 10N.286.49.B3]|uniref:tRNA-uridine aminocarboxypropyltransferase n=1 Tax=Vibrio sp. 10N.286.49.B3 TaxID=1880855 RepID=UPI000C8217B0|nr:tRNA-uridine aminocarboxypropyltransferase [Vibrio sp. 10N.286.49.B3]PMH45449.1 DTW domain-containing protein [Vibrio sp. 10N.286.49.B3]